MAISALETALNVAGALVEFYLTFVFAKHVRETNSVFRSATIDKDVIAQYGCLSLCCNIIGIVLYWVTLCIFGNAPLYVYFNVYQVGKMFMVSSALMLVAMKYKLNRLAVQRNADATKQSAKASQASASLASKMQKTQVASDIESGLGSETGSQESSQVGSVESHISEKPMMKANKI